MFNDCYWLLYNNICQYFKKKNNNEADYFEKYWEGRYKVVFFPGLYTLFHPNYPLLISTNRWDFSSKIISGENSNICASLRIFDIKCSNPLGFKNGLKKTSPSKRPGNKSVSSDFGHFCKCKVTIRKWRIHYLRNRDIPVIELLYCLNGGIICELAPSSKGLLLLVA